MLLLLSFAAFGVLGFHPYAEDGGIYAAATSAQIDPDLFPAGRAWALGQTQRTLFVPVLALLCRRTGLPLPWALLLTQWLSIFATLAVALRLCRVCFRDARDAPWAVAWLAAMAGVPVAGTALYLFDPYVTARSAATPLLLLAVLYGLQRKGWRCVLAWAVAVTMHPLMAAWGLLPLLCFWLVLQARRELWRLLWVVIPLSLGFAASVWIWSPSDPAAVHAVALTRDYWFLSTWRWYEWAGAVVPFALLIGLERSPAIKEVWSREGQLLARVIVLAAALALALGVVFAWTPGYWTGAARTQPLRTLHEGYTVFLLLFGGACVGFGRRSFGAEGRFCWLAVSCIVISAAGMAGLQRQLYPASGNMEVPWRPPVNQWEQAFLWAREHTPREAVFALDSRYTTAMGEDAQGFRAIALRSALPDIAKDAGIASVVPALAEAWRLQSAATSDLDRIGDGERRARLLPMGVSWLVLSADAETGLTCPYRNAAAKVCRF